MFDTLSSSLAGLGNNLAINGNQTVNESAGQSDTVNGVTYRVSNVTSYNENDGKLLMAPLVGLIGPDQPGAGLR